ncbi:MAG TPA: response regulator [Candidatus Dormibacteraeota bacterium]|nr:response regulator [Candidatus Dormibacteraeota bacterium]
MATPLRVLLIEDSEADAELVVRLLRTGGYEVESRRVDSASGLTECLDAAWDIAISDYVMPGFSGLAALAMIRERSLDIPFLFVSGTMGEETAVNAIRMGAHDYIMKDHMARLVPTIRRELEQAALRTERKQIELRMRQLERFEALGKLAGGIAHDFNNVIGAIMGWAGLGGRDIPGDSPAAESFRQIEQQATRAAGLTRQLLAFARRQVIHPSTIDLNHLVGETAELLQQLIGEGIHMTLQLAANLRATQADSGQIEQVLMNLCVNARDAMPHGGNLTIETRNVLLEAGDPRLSGDCRPGPYVALSVSDSGIGMDAATIEQIFDPFFTTKEVGQGTGLGLATTLGIVKQHDGFIVVQSRPNEGSQFHVYLPAAAGEALPEPVAIEAAVRGGSETILVAEDHDGILRMACAVLRSFGYRVVAAQDGEEAVRAFEQNRDEVSLALMDMVMPKMHGPEAYEEIRRCQPRLPVIFTSGYPEENAAMAACNAAVLPKPYPPKALARKVREVLDAAPQ